MIHSMMLCDVIPWKYFSWSEILFFLSELSLEAGFTLACISQPSQHFTHIFYSLYSVVSLLVLLPKRRAKRARYYLAYVVYITFTQYQSTQTHAGAHATGVVAEKTNCVKNTDHRESQPEKIVPRVTATEPQIPRVPNPSAWCSHLRMCAISQHAQYSRCVCAQLLCKPVIIIDTRSPPYGVRYLHARIWANGSWARSCGQTFDFSFLVGLLGIVCMYERLRTRTY